MKRRIRIRKLVSVALALAFLMQLAPAPFAAKANADEEIVLNFTAAAGKNPADMTVAENGFAINSEISSPDILTNTGAGGNQRQYELNGRGLKTSIYSGECLGIDFQAPQAGRYQITVDGYRMSAVVAQALFAVNGKTAGEFNFLDTAVSNWTLGSEVLANTVTLSAGTNTLMIYGTNPVDGRRLVQIGKITLKLVDDTVDAWAEPMLTQTVEFMFSPRDASGSATRDVQYLSYEGNGHEINMEETTPAILPRANTQTSASEGLKADMQEVGETLSVDFKVHAAGKYDVQLCGKRYEMFGATVSVYLNNQYMGDFNFSSEDETSIVTEEKWLNSVTLEAGRNNLKFQRINSGTYRHSYIYLRELKLYGVDAHQRVEKIQMNAAAQTLKAGAEADAGVQVILESGRAYQFGSRYGGETDSAHMLSLSSSAESVFTVEADGKLRATGDGAATLEVLAVIDGNEYREEFPIAVGAQAFTVDFTASGLSNPLEATLAGHGFAINQSDTDAGILSESTREFTLGATGLRSRVFKGETLAVDFQAPAGGSYAITMSGYCLSFATTCAAVYLNGSFLGAFQFTDPACSSWTLKDLALNAAQLQEGSNTLAFVALGSQVEEDRPLVQIGKLAFTPIAALPTVQEITMNPAAQSLILGESMPAGLEISFSDGGTHAFGPQAEGMLDADNSLSLVSGNESVFTVDEDGLLTPVAVGSAELIVSAVVMGVRTEKQFPISVALPQREFALASSSGILRIERGGSARTELTAKLEGVAVDLSAAGNGLSAVSEDPEVAEASVEHSGGKSYVSRHRQSGRLYRDFRSSGGAGVSERADDSSPGNRRAGVYPICRAGGRTRAGGGKKPGAHRQYRRARRTALQRGDHCGLLR